MPVLMKSAPNEALKSVVEAGRPGKTMQADKL